MAPLCRPAVIISYAISALMAFLSALTFVEMAVDYPLAGSSFNYTLAVRLLSHPAALSLSTGKLAILMIIQRSELPLPL